MTRSCACCGNTMTEVDIGVFECHFPYCPRYMEGETD